MKAQETKRQYPHRLDKFLTFMNLQGTIQEKCARLYETANKNINLFQSNIFRFINFQKERIERGEISEGTLCNYLKALKLFCNMNDIVINWKKISEDKEIAKISSEESFEFDENGLKTYLKQVITEIKKEENEREMK